MKTVTIRHPEAGEADVPESAVQHWRALGWEPASTGGKTADQALIDDAPPRISKIANAIGYALTQRGVQITAADAITAAYRVVDQDPAVHATEAAADGEKTVDPPDDPAENSAGETSATSEQPADAPDQQAKPERRTRRASTKESEL